MVDVHSAGKRIQVEEISNLIIGGQTGADTIQFYFKDTLNGVDLSDPAFNWFIQFKNKNGQGTPVPLISAHEDGYIKLAWTPDSLATQVAGRMQIQVFATIVEGEGEAAVTRKKWVSEDAVIYVQENLNPDPIVEVDPPIFDYYLTMYTSLKEAAEAAATTAEEQAIVAAQQAGSAADSAGEALLSAQAAAESAGDALVSAEAAALSEGNALASEQAAALSKTGADTSAAAALASKNAAATSESNAAGSAAAALASKNAAGISATDASGHAAAALASKNMAATSESNAAASAATALASKNAAALSEDNSADSAAAALASKNAAALSKTGADTSAAAALASQQAAALSAGNASDSAAAALASKEAAALSEAAAQAAQVIAEEKAALLSNSLAQIAVNKAAIEALSMNGDIVGLKYNKITKVYTRLGAAASWSAGRCNGAYDANVVSDFDQHPLYGLRKKFKANNDFSSIIFRGEDGYAELDGDHYVRQPIGWFADYEDSDDRIVLLAAVPVPGLAIHPNFLDKNGKPLPYVDYACVEGSVVDGIMYSKPDLQPKNRITLTAANLAARSKGSATSGIYTLEPWIASDFEVLMMAVEFGTFDAQSAIGLGMTTFLNSDSYKTTFDGATPNTFITTNSIASQFQVGDYVDLGTNYYNGSLVIGRKILEIADYNASNKILTFDGAEVTVPINTVVTWASCPVPSSMIDIMQGKSGYILEREIESRSHVCWRDIWDKWGNDWEIKDGTIKYDNRMYVGTDPETYHLYYNNPAAAGSTYEDTGYVTLQTSGYVGSMKRVGKAGSSLTIPVVDSLGGASVGGYGAYHYDSNGAGAARIVLVGGYRIDGRYCSPVYVLLYSDVGTSAFHIASRLFHRPK